MNNKIKHLTQSMLKDYTWCQKKFYYSYIQLLKPVAYHFPFAIGAAVDDGLGSLLLYGNVKKAIEIAKNTLYNRRMEFEKYGSFSLKQEQEFQYQLVCADAMIQAYAVYNKKFLDNIKASNIQSIFTSKISGVPIPITGKIDGIIKYRNNTHLYELKTTKRIDINFVSQYYPQLYHYKLLLESQNQELSTHVILDIIEKPTIRQTQHEDAEEFIERLYDQYITGGEKFRLQYIKIKKRFLKQYMEFLKITAYSILESIEKDQFPANKFVCVIRSRCEFYSLCTYGLNPVTKRNYIKKICLSEELLK